MEEVPWLRFS